MPAATRSDAQTLARAVAGQCIARRVRRLGRLVTRIYEDALRPHGLTTAQFGMLSAMILGSPMAPAELGRRLDLEKSTVSRNLARMVDRGWVTQTPGDARGVELRVTAVGRRLFEQVHPAWQAAQAAASALLTAEASRA